MIASEIQEGQAQSGLSSLLRRTLAASALIFFLLEWWRPCFFLTDDNLSGGYSFFVERGHHLLTGRSPFYSDYLFDGNYNLLRDPTFFGWHPLYLLVSLLADTPFRFLMIDVDVFFLFMLTAAGFVTLAHSLRRELLLSISDGWIMFYTLSFVYSVFALTTSASWFNFAGNHSALPWLTLGLLQKNRRYSLGIITLFSLHQWLAGHLAPTISTSLLFTFFALGLSLSRRSFQPLLCWIFGSVLAVLILSPLLITAAHGFFVSARSAGVSVEEMRANNIDFQMFPTSLFMGMALWLIHPPEEACIYQSYTLSLGASAAVWCLIPALANRAKWGGLELICAAMLGLLAFLIVRPLWMAQLMIHLPILKSMRWPFREFLQFQFFLHLLLLLRPPNLGNRILCWIALFGTILVVPPLVFYYVPPTLNAMNWDRGLIISGKTDRYWEKVRPLLNPSDHVAVIIPLSIYAKNRLTMPYSLLGTYNYPMLTRIINVSGYSPTVPSDRIYDPLPYYPFGAFKPEQREALQRKHPDLKFITLESLRPLKVTLSSRIGPTIDLTPLVP